MTFDNRNTRGFTLVELLVVISIIGVLMAVLLPSLSRAREQGQRIVCMSRQRQLGAAHVMYQETYDGWTVPAAQEKGTREYWYNTLGPFFKHRPSDHGTHADDMGREILRCPLDKLAYPKMLNPHGLNPEGWLSYALNSQPTRHMSGRDKKYAGVGGNKITNICRPAQAMLHCDFAYRVWVCDSVTLTKRLYASEPSAHYDKMQGYPEQNKTIEAAYRHGGRMNVLWADGHVTHLPGKIPSAEDNPVFWGRYFGTSPHKN